MNDFILSYNPTLTFPSEGQLINYLRVNRLIAGYYQPFVGTYVLKSEQTVFTLTENFNAFFDVWPFLLVQFNGLYAGGKLPTEIWNWLHFDAAPQAPPPPPDSTAALGSGETGLLGLLRNTSRF